MIEERCVYGSCMISFFMFSGVRMQIWVFWTLACSHSLLQDTSFTTSGMSGVSLDRRHLQCTGINMCISYSLRTGVMIAMHQYLYSVCDVCVSIKETHNGKYMIRCWQTYGGSCFLIILLYWVCLTMRNTTSRASTRHSCSVCSFEQNPLIVSITRFVCDREAFKSASSEADLVGKLPFNPVAPAANFTSPSASRLMLIAQSTSSALSFPIPSTDQMVISWLTSEYRATRAYSFSTLFENDFLKTMTCSRSYFGAVGRRG